MKNKKPSVFSFSILFLSFPVGCLQSRQQSDKQTIPQKEKKDESFSDFSPPFSAWFNGPIRALYGHLILKSDWTGRVCLSENIRLHLVSDLLCSLQPIRGALTVGHAPSCCLLLTPMLNCIAFRVCGTK